MLEKCLECGGKLWYHPNREEDYWYVYYCKPCNIWYTYDHEIEIIKQSSTKSMELTATNLIEAEFKRVEITEMGYNIDVNVLMCDNDTGIPITEPSASGVFYRVRAKKKFPEREILIQELWNGDYYPFRKGWNLRMI